MRGSSCCWQTTLVKAKYSARLLRLQYQNCENNSMRVEKVYHFAYRCWDAKKALN
jgi:hypothetical protein